MPITAKLSRQFYEKLGDEVTNELVTWLNAVDDSYRQEFKELFAVNFGRVESEMARLRAEMDARGARIESTLAQQMSKLDARLSHMRTDLILWMFGFWIASWAAMIGTLIAIRQLLH